MSDLRRARRRPPSGAVAAACVGAALTASALVTGLAGRRPGVIGTALSSAALLSWGVVLVLLARMRRAAMRDAEARSADRADAARNEARYRQILDTAREGIVTVDTERTMSVLNQRASDLLGYSVHELVDAREVGPPEADEGSADPGFTGERETTIRSKDGTTVPVLLNESALHDSQGRYTGQLGMLTDLTERVGLEADRAFRALHDPLTGLPNRLLVVESLAAALDAVEPGEPATAVVLIDIDGFKDLNSVYGHDGADLILVEIAARLSTAARPSDIVGRFGGDEFVVISDGSVDFADTLAEHLRGSLAAPFVVAGVQVDITTSIGVAVAREGDRATDLLRGADVAMLQAKANGRNRIEFFTEALRATSRRNVAIVSELTRAVERREFSLRFQPVVSLADEAIIGAEALIRWEHPRRGTLAPQEFIPVAEHTGLIEPIGQWVIEETCRRLAGWQRHTPELAVSLNVSVRQLSAGVLVDVVRAAVAASAVDPSHLALELTEAVLMDDLDLSIDTLTELRAVGVTISVDDFGTGYSSLSYLNRFPVDVLKLDQSFVAGLPHDHYDRALVQAVLTIATALDLSVVAEGVETAAQARSLLDLGCQVAQGYYFHRPLTPEAFEAALIAARSGPV